MSPRLVADVGYLAVSLYVTVHVGHRLHRQGCPFLEEIFPDRLHVGQAINNLLLTGYYLVNIALAVLMLQRTADVGSFRTALESSTSRLGVVMMTLGVMHAGNIAILLAVHRGLHRRGRGPIRL
ncbi:MAG: hypothetical protein ACK5Q5_17355 [Planctomycetaceae bacterium]